MRFIIQSRYYHLSLQEDYNENLLILIIHFYKHLQLLHFVILLHLVFVDSSLLIQLLILRPLVKHLCLVSLFAFVFSLAKFTSSFSLLVWLELALHPQFYLNMLDFFTMMSFLRMMTQLKFLINLCLRF
jgi:hypothetical protein